MSLERILIELRYRDGESEAIAPSVHPDLPLEHQAALLRQYIVKQLAQGRPLAIEIDRASPSMRRRDTRLIVPADAIRNVEVSIVQAARQQPAPSADEYTAPQPANLVQPRPHDGRA